MTSVRTITAHRLKMRELGYKPIPVNGKKPGLPEWPKLDADEATIKTWPVKRPLEKNTGALTKNMSVIDTDIIDAEAVDRIEALIRERFGDKGQLLRRVGNPPKCAYPFKTSEPFEKKILRVYPPGMPRPEKLKDVQKIEILGDGQQVVVDGIHPDTKKPYAWSGGEPWTVPHDALPELTAEAADAFLTDARALLVSLGWNIWKEEPNEKATQDDEGFYPLIVELAIKVWGEPTARSGGDYRFGTHGSKSVSARTGVWFDFENNTGGGIRDLMKLVSDSKSADIAVNFRATPYEWTDPTKIPRRQWLYLPHYIREFLSLVFSSGGKGKSSLLIVEALAMVTGKSLLNVAPEKKLRVWYWNGEDPQLELQRRFAAAIKHYGLRPEDIGDRLFIDSGRTLPIVIAEEGKYSSGTFVCEPLIKKVITTLRDNQIDVLIIDPFVSCHRVSENDNSAIDRVAKSWARIAEEAHCSIMAAHHNRKSGGEAATVDDGRGASALRDGGRTARIVNTMTTAEAERAKITRREQGYYFRADIGKFNITPPPETADWFKFVSVDLGNNHEGWMSGGDQVGVVTPFTYPVAADELPTITTASIVAAQSAIKAGGPWRYDSRSKKQPWVGIPIAGALGVDLLNKLGRRAIVDLISDWLGAGVLKQVNGHDERYEVRSYVEAGADPVVPSTTG